MRVKSWNALYNQRKNSFRGCVKSRAQFSVSENLGSVSSNLLYEGAPPPLHSRLLQHERDIESVEAINEAIARANLILKGCIMGQ